MGASDDDEVRGSSPSAPLHGFSGSSFAPVGRLTVEIAIASPRAVHRDFESRADGTHPRPGEPAKPIHQHPDRDAFD